MVAVAFFPRSLPNETISSRIGRFHIVSGNRTPGATFAQLGFPVGTVDHIVSPYLEAMARSLPGDPQANFATLIQQNTLLPLFKPFLGKRSQPDDGDIISRLPRRVVGNQGESHLCVECIKEAKAEFGFGYWMRTHQAPGVTACWKHGCQLISSCTQCHFPFQRRGKCLTAPWHPCEHCALEIDSMPVKAASEHERNYARYVHDLLELDLEPIAPDLLSTVYRKRIQEMGFVRNTRSTCAAARPPRATAMTKFTDDLIDLLGEDFITKVDRAYAQGRTSFWIRFSIVDGVMDMPLPRHILLGMRLFESPARFRDAVLHAQKEGIPAAPRRVRLAEEDIVLRDQHRARIAKEVKRKGDLQLEDLWRRALRSTSWLMENDRKWLERAIAAPRAAATLAKDDSDPDIKDRQFALQVEERCRELLGKEGRPECITIERLFTALPISSSHYYFRRKELPLLSEQIALCRETTWCLRARRILWAIGQARELGMSPASAIPSLSSVSYYAVKRILAFTRWDIDALARKEINIPAELACAGISVSWQGPGNVPSTEVGGRSYEHQTSRRHNRDTSLLRPAIGIDNAASAAKM